MWGMSAEIMSKNWQMMGFDFFKFADMLFNGGPEDITPTIASLMLGVVFGYLFQIADGSVRDMEMFELGFGLFAGVGIATDVVEYVTDSGMLDLLQSAIN